MKKSKREKLADGIIDKLISTFYSKKQDILLKKMGGIDPDIAAQAKKVQQSQDALKKDLQQYKKDRSNFAKKAGIRVDSDGSLNAEDLLQWLKQNRHKNK